MVYGCFSSETQYTFLFWYLPILISFLPPLHTHQTCDPLFLRVNEGQRSLLYKYFKLAESDDSQSSQGSKATVCLIY